MALTSQIAFDAECEVSGGLTMIDCFGILDDAKIRRYFELGCEVKGLGRSQHPPSSPLSPFVPLCLIPMCLSLRASVPLSLSLRTYLLSKNIKINKTSQKARPDPGCVLNRGLTMSVLK
jgi:hypothetical protein